MKSQLLKCLLLMLLTALLTYFITCHFGLCRKDGDDGGTRNVNTICMDYDNVPPATLTTQMVKSMVTQYSGAQLNSIQKDSLINHVPEDARSIWFDLETLKQFMYQIEHNAGNHFAESDKKKLGVRIYYAAYPSNTKMREMAADQTDPNFSYNPAYENLHTLVMIPTISGADKENYDFNPLDASTYNGYVNMPKGGKYYTDDDYTGISLGTSSNPASANANQINATNNGVSARNHGLLSPPHSISGNAF
jgi:hypothetical protein